MSLLAGGYISEKVYLVQLIEWLETLKMTQHLKKNCGTAESRVPWEQKYTVHIKNVCVTNYP